MFGNDRNILLTSEDTIRRIVASEVEQALNRACEEVREQAAGTYTRRQVRELLKCSIPTVKRMEDEGKLHPSVVNGKKLYRKMEVNALIR